MMVSALLEDLNHWFRFVVIRWHVNMAYMRSLLLYDPGGEVLVPLPMSDQHGSTGSSQLLHIPSPQFGNSQMAVTKPTAERSFRGTRIQIASLRNK
jgi:hypothetical protein